jgi:outer membrane protein assembly factor BamD (BamD/ComL family)
VPQVDTPPTPPKPVVAKPPRSVEVPPKEPTAPASRDTQLSQERALLEVARTTLARGEVVATLDAVERHAREFPDGRLGEEREVLFIQALVQAGRKDEAARHAEAFRQKFPDSLMLPAVDAVLAP